MSDMKLPAGKTCSDCLRFYSCSRLFRCPETNTTCDWSPSRFAPKGAADVEQLRHLLREIADLKRSRKHYLDKPSGTTATVNIPLELLERIDAITGKLE